MNMTQERYRFVDPGREEAALLARFPSAGWREREQLKEISSWFEMAASGQPAPRHERRETACEFRGRIGRLWSPTLRLTILIASTIFAAGLLFPGTRWLG